MPGELIQKLNNYREKTVGILFYAALTLELVLMIVEKSELPLAYESYVFRVTFLLTILAVLIMEHDKKEWIAIAILLVLAGICYYSAGKNDMLRLVALLMAGRDIDLKKTMKYAFYVCLVGFLLIIVLSVAGVLGSVAVTMDYGRAEGVETRYVFGFGHPNTLFSSVYALILMWIWIYGKRAGVLPYLVAIASVVMLIILTDSRTGILILVLTMLLAIMARVFKKTAEMKWPYYAGGLVVLLLSAVLSPMAAWASQEVYSPTMPDWVQLFFRIEESFNYRISNLYYSSDNHMALLKNWKLFAPRGNESFFDMGWVRLFYWYGIIPTVLIILAIMVVIYESMKLGDIRALILIISLSIYTLAEATFVTRFLGRDFFLLIASVYLGRWFRTAFIEKSTKGTENV